MPLPCIDTAATAYNVPPPVIEQAITAASRARDGRIGVMGIPSAWLPILAKAGFVVAKVRDDDCSNILAGTWILALDHLHESDPSTKPAEPHPPAKSGGLSAGASLARVAEHAGVAARCIVAAANFYDLPVPLFVGVLRTEYGRIGEVSHNTNGSYDIGPAQVNSSWLPELKRMGISEAALRSNGCLNVGVGAWVLAQSMHGASTSDPLEFWRRVGDYNSHTPAFNLAYQRKVWEHMQSGN